MTIAKGQFFERSDGFDGAHLFTSMNTNDCIEPGKLAMVLGVASYTNPTHFDEDCMPYVVADYYVYTDRCGTVDIGRDDEGILHFTESSGLFSGAVVLYAFAGDICCTLADNFWEES